MGSATSDHTDVGVRRRVRAIPAGAALLAAVALVGVAPSVSTAAGSHARRHPAVPQSPLPPPATDNPSWSGELAWAAKNGVAAFDHVTGAWSQPSIVPSASAQYADTWVGIDGYDGTLLQAGTTAQTRDGAVSYEPWFVAWTGTASGMTVINEPVSAGDQLKVEINRTGPGTWAVTIDDETAPWTWSTTVAYAADGSTAEWIEEAPGTWATPSHYQTLADYGSVTFTTVRADGGAPQAVTAFDIAEDGTVVSYASTYQPVHGSFTIQYGQPGSVRSTTRASGPTLADRVYGSTADATAAAELEREFTDEAGDCPGTAGSRPVILATDSAYADALSSAYLAGYLGTGTLLTPTGSLSPATLTAIHKEGITKVYVVGGDLAVGTAVVNELRSTPADQCGGAIALPGTVMIQVTRVAGASEYETAAAIAEMPPASNVGAASFVGAYAGTGGAGGDGRYNDTAGVASIGPSAATALPTALVASGKGFQDAESASALAYAERFPILLTTPSALSPDVSSAVQALGIKQAVVLGGEDAVSDAVVSALEDLGVSVLRVAGQTFSATSVELAEFEVGSANDGDGLGWLGTGAVTVARGDGYTDGLAGAALAAGGPSAAAREPLLLTLSPTDVGPALAGLLRTAETTGIGGERVSHFTILGGPLAITDTAIDAMGADL